MRLITILFCLALISCNQNNDDREVNEQPIPAPQRESIREVSGCYESVFGKDSTQMRLDLFHPDSVKGTLSVHYYEKDNADGTFTGVIGEERLVGWYNFNSEGKSSVRQMVFRISGDSLIEGFGNIEMKGDTAYFKNINDLNYLSQRPLVKIPCR